MQQLGQERHKHLGSAVLCPQDLLQDSPGQWPQQRQQLRGRCIKLNHLQVVLRDSKGGIGFNMMRPNAPVRLPLALP